MARRGFTSGDTAEASENHAQKGELEALVVGFYRGESEPVILVVFCGGATERYCRADLRLVS